VLKNSKLLRHKIEQKLTNLDLFRDKLEVIGLKWRVIYRPVQEYFCSPILLPRHQVVDRLISGAHVRACHVGTQDLMSLLRERFWFFDGRRYVRSIVRRCMLCKRYCTKHFQTSSPPLPEN